MSDNSDLSLALTTQSNRDNDPSVTQDVTDEIKGSAMFQQPWQDLLQSAPVAIGATGALYVACFSDAGQRVKFEPPVGGFQFIQDASLQAALIRCGDQGRLAFMEAQTGLMAVNDTTTRAAKKVGDIVQIIGDPPTAKRMLKPAMGQLKNMADDCYTRVVNIDKKFETWLLYTSELHAVCVGTQASDEEKLRAAEVSLVVEQTRFDSQKSTVADAKAANEKLGHQLDVASEAFKKASDNFPTGWDILGQQIVGGLADMATTALGQVISGYASNMNPMAKISAGAGMFNDVIHPPARGPAGGQPNSTPAPAPPLQQPTLPPHSSDPAYGVIQKDLPYLTVLGTILKNGKGGGVDWDEASGADGAAQSVDYVVQVLTDAQSDFSRLATSDAPSQDLGNILTTSISIAKAIKDAAVSGNKAGGTFAAADSTQVKQWQTDFQNLITKAQTMAAVARSLPGTSPGGIPLMANGPDPAVQIAQTNAKSAQAQATLEAAKNRLSTTQDSFMRSQELYQKNTALLLEQENKLTEIQANLSQLSQTKMGLQEVKAVLESAIKLVVNVKANIVNLCLFFQTMSITIDGLVNTAVKGFLDDIAANTAADGSDKSVFKVGDYTLGDLQRSMMYHAAITIRAQFLVFGDIANMWTQLSTQFIMPGLQMLDQLSLGGGGDQKAQQKVVAQLHSWCDSAIAGVKKIAGDSQQRILDGMADRIDAVQSITKQIPASPVMQAAITTGTNTTKQAAQDALVANAKAKPFNRFAV